MARVVAQLCLRGARLVLGGAITLGFWTLWLVLSLLIVLQIYIASTNELQVPAFVQQALLERLAVSGVHISFGHTLFDPSGRILIENVAVTLEGFEEPIATARSVYARIDPWALAVKRFEPLETRVTGMTVRVPAMLSASGRADEIIQDLDGAVLSERGALSIEYLHCHVGTLAVSVAGNLRLGARPSLRAAPLPVVEFFARNYIGLIRRGAAALGQISNLDKGALSVRLEPAAAGGAVARSILIADGIKLSAPTPLQAGPMRISGRWSFLDGAPASGEVLLSLASIEAPGFRDSARGIEGRFDVGFPPGPAKSDGPRFAIKSADLSSASCVVEGLGLRDAIVALSSPGPDLLQAPSVRASAQALAWGEPVALDAVVEPARKAARVKFRASVAPEALDFVGARVGRALTPFVRLANPVEVAGDARFDPGWKFADVAGRLDAAKVYARGVMIDEVRGDFRFDGSHLYAPEAYARIGENFARGSYEQEVATRRYRFLLDGRLRPLDITPWIAGGWWRTLFGNFDFSAAPPSASIDLRSCWTDGRQSKIFLSVDSPGPVVRGARFDRVRLTLFSRPQFQDGIGFEAIRRKGSVKGSFARRLDPNAGVASQSVEFSGTSSVDLDAIAQLIGPRGPAMMAPYAFSQPPDLKVSGRLDGPQAPGGSHEALHIEASSGSAFRFHDFPLDSVSFTADVRDDDLELSQVKAGFAGGAATGKARVWGRGADRRLWFDATLGGAFLDRAILGVEDFSAARSKRAAPAPGSFLKDKTNVKLDASVTAEGRMDDPSSFQGSGSADLQGAELGEVHMLGLLSDLLRFTALRFTTAHASFKLNGNRLDFPEINVTGANSAITAHGSYSIDRHELDFRARINPFKESRTLPQQFIDAMLAPLAQVFELQLSGTIEKPSWTFANGPGNLLRNLSQPPSTPTPSPLKEQ
ncbi:MAG: AsmA-like C-terminal region-containing protein [Opitutaceae bacterium]